MTSLGGHTRPDCNARYDVRIKLVETWLFVCLTWRGNVGRLFVMVLHVVLTPMKSWTLIGREWINSVTCLNTRFWLVVPPSSDYYYWGSALRVVKLIALSSAIRVSFWAFYKLWTLTFHSRLIQTQSSWQSAKGKKAALNLAILWLTIKTWIKLQWKMYMNIFIRRQI